MSIEPVQLTIKMIENTMKLVSGDAERMDFTSRIKQKNSTEMEMALLGIIHEIFIVTTSVFS